MKWGKLLVDSSVSFCQRWCWKEMQIVWEEGMEVGLGVQRSED